MVDPPLRGTTDVAHRRTPAGRPPPLRHFSDRPAGPLGSQPQAMAIPSPRPEPRSAQPLLWSQSHVDDKTRISLGRLATRLRWTAGDQLELTDTSVDRIAAEWEDLVDRVVERKRAV